MFKGPKFKRPNFREFKAHILVSLLLLLLLHSSAEAQAFGRVTVVVKDEAGKPLQGVNVTVTCEELKKFREETQTNKKGKAIISVTDATKVYDFRIEYEGFQPVDLPIKPEIRGNLTREVVMSEGQTVVTDTGTRTYTPLEKTYNEGVEALKGGDLETAKAKFIEVLDKNEKTPPAVRALAGVYMEEKNYPAALEQTNRYLELQPDDPDAQFMLYDLHVAMGNQKEADAILKSLKEKDRGGDTVALIYNAGVAAYKIGNYASARSRFLEALEIDPSLKEALGALAFIANKEGNFQEAAEYAEKHIALAPDDQRSLRIRWNAYTQLGNQEKADMAFKAVAAADPKILAVELYNIGNDLFEAGNTAAAITEFERVIEIDPDYSMAYYRLGTCYAATDTAKAKAHLQKFIDMAPDHAEAATAKEMLSYLN